MKLASISFYGGFLTNVIARTQVRALAFLIGVFVALCMYGEASAQTAAEQAAAAASASEKQSQAAVHLAALAASAASLTIAQTWSAPGTVALYLVPGLALLGILVSLGSIKVALNKTSWSLADALSEEAQVSYYKETTEEKDGKKVTTRELVRDNEGKPFLVTEMRASTSRVIALMGMMAILFMFVGFGVFALFSFGSNGVLPDSIDRVVKFLLAGLTLFAPYLVNKFASLFQGLSGSK